MKAFVCAAVLALMVGTSSAFFTNGVFSLGALSLTSGDLAPLALTVQGTTAYLSAAGIVAAGIGLLGAGIIKAAILASFADDSRHKRDVSGASITADALEQVDGYFYSIADMDVDDCGKRLVCEIETLPVEQMTDEERLIAGLFGERNVIDPANAKAEYDLAAYLGASTGSKIACGRRYHRCPVDRKTISQALAKHRRDQEAAKAAAAQQPQQ